MPRNYERMLRPHVVFLSEYDYESNKLRPKRERLQYRGERNGNYLK